MIDIVRKKSLAILICLITICVVVITVSLILCSGSGEEPEMPPEDNNGPSFKSEYPMGVYTYGAVVSNGGPCAAIGKKILVKYSSAVDALIATMVCESAACMQNMGPGGGFILTGFDSFTSKVYTLNARETAPAASSQDMYHSNPSASQRGGLSIAIPGELKGYFELYKRYGGKAPWEVLFTDTIKLCLDGVPVNKHLAASFRNYEKEIMSSPTLRDMLVNDAGVLPSEGDSIKLPKLARTLRMVSINGPDVLYNGSLTAAFVDDIRRAGGIITAKDLANYNVRWEEPIKAKLSNGLTLYSVPPPGSGLILSFVLRLLDKRLNTGSEIDDVQRITEAFKFGYGRRSELGDPHYSNVSQIISDMTSDSYISRTIAKMLDNTTKQDPRFYGAHFDYVEDHGTANIVVIGPHGDAVVATSTVNLVFGSMVVSESTGIILNDEMDDFSAPNITNYFGLPPSSANFIEPGKRPMSSMCPTLIMDSRNRVRLAIGSAGGTRITTSTALVIMRNLWYNQTIKESVDSPRFHHQLVPMLWAFEDGVPERIVDQMRELGHEIKPLGKKWQSSVTGVTYLNGTFSTVCDFRRPGSIDGIN